MQNLANLEKNLGYKFKDEQLLIKALTHKSCKKPYNNERLEFLGDAVMDLIVAEYLCKKFRKTDEGDLSKLRAALVNEKSFSNLAKSVNLGDFLFISAAEEHNKGRFKASLLSDAFEAVMGAIYLESGLESCTKIALNLLENEYKSISLDALAKDYKTMLQEITQAKFGLTPEYKLISTSGPDHQKEFKMAVFLDEKKYGEAVGKSKKDAEQQAAKITIDEIKKVKP
ncbi:ribonuclease III [Campylobacter geochelonis]|uniref:Ribonuclease 3 n=1 Tax=Campylobacter geochelonis TaxID=1780362 RepID=A0A128EBP2_9BACT|nr:ribonuclease III [Campylobacter geochelonis]QKF70374.1 ribonuclease III [Campylobacter geochelonis]CZE46213.1 ribonuclease III [Campylobacter geochelonis]CZE46416.1 ribonuclease III [Campylobacter geochelonis]CZE50740.1 ribonuclease III [Campylobacter geochelonis]